jgi:hypothetical protein
VKRFLLAATLVLAALGILTVIALPPPTIAAPPPAWKYLWPIARGAYHMHSLRSDGTGTLDEIAAAAARAGLEFVIVTDHGNGTRAPEPPAYRSGVLCIDGVEISTDRGHYAALGLPQTPFALAGNVRDVIADVRYFGGFGFAAHPGSGKQELRWTEWDAPFDGVEWLNADSEWRDEFWGSLAGALLTYPWRPTETIASLLDRPAPVIAEWERLTRTRRVPALAAADAHARLGLGQSRDPYEGGLSAHVPAYEVSFGAFANRVVLDRPLTGDAAADAALVLAAVREGRAYTIVDGLASGGAFELRARSQRGMARIGEYLDADPATFVEAQLTAPPGTTMVLLRDGEPIYDTTDGLLRVGIGAEPGAYRMEARLPGASPNAVPWLLTNPIYVGLQDAHARAATPPPGPPPATTRTGIATASWRAEADAGSTSGLSASALPDGMPALAWRFSLAGGPRREQYAAIWFPAGDGFATQTRFQMRAQSDQPRRVSVQLRAPGNERWVVYLFVDTTLRAFDLDFADFRAAGPGMPPAPQMDRIDSLLLVIDTLNTLPGSQGTIWIPDLWLAKP